MPHNTPTSPISPKNYSYLADIIIFRQQINMKPIRKLLPDAFALSGLSMLGYGLYVFEPWVSFVVVGCLMMAGGLFMGREG